MRAMHLPRVALDEEPVIFSAGRTSPAAPSPDATVRRNEPSYRARPRNSTAIAE